MTQSNDHRPLPQGVDATSSNEPYVINAGFAVSRHVLDQFRDPADADKGFTHNDDKCGRCGTWYSREGDTREGFACVICGPGLPWEPAKGTVQDRNAGRRAIEAYCRQRAPVADGRAAVPELFK